MKNRFQARYLIVGSIAVVLTLAFNNCGQFSPSTMLSSERAHGEMPHDHSGHHHSPPAATPTGGTLTGSIPKAFVGKASRITEGHFITMDAGKQLGMNITGTTVMIRGENGSTRVDVAAFGLPANSKMPVHVHAGTCASGAAGHYLKDETITTVIESNEIWPTVITDGNGYGYGHTQVDHIAGEKAVSVVIHGGPNNAKVACADLRQTNGQGLYSYYLQGSLMPSIPSPFGSVFLVSLFNGQTEVRLAMAGLEPASKYSAHLHTLGCGNNESAHYKIEPGIIDAVESNEVGLSFTADKSGYGLGYVRVNHNVRQPEAKSVVVHSPTGQRISCADLALGFGGMLPLESGIARIKTIAGSGAIARGVDTTTVSVRAAGLDKGKTYIAHVHNRPCLLGGGAHYKFDESVTTTVESNELFLRLAEYESSGVFFANTTVNHIARPDATSVVIHDPADGVKLACVDLY